MAAIYEDFGTRETKGKDVVFSTCPNPFGGITLFDEILTLLTYTITLAYAK
jgi:hypothetical protein